MTTERLYLLLTAILTGALWIPVVIGYVSSRGMLKSSDYKVAHAFKFGGRRGIGKVKPRSNNFRGRGKALCVQG